MDYEKLGLFYLGKRHDPVARARLDVPVLYDASDLVTHAVIVGMTGSGKTGLGIGLIEEAAIDGIPVLAVDPKGDLANLLLTFPNLSADEFTPWVNQDEARATGQTPETYAAGEAARWAAGLSGVGTGCRTHRAPAGSGRLPDLHARQHHGPSDLDCGLVRGAAAGSPRGSRPAGRSRRVGGHQRVDAGRHRRRAPPQPGAHPALHALQRAMAWGSGSRPGVAHLAGPEPAGHQGRRHGPRIVLPVEGSLRVGHAAQSVAGRAQLRGLAAGRVVGPGPPAVHG